MPGVFDTGGGPGSTHFLKLTVPCCDFSRVGAIVVDNGGGSVYHQARVSPWQLTISI
jgi:hypothetical protein